MHEKAKYFDVRSDFWSRCWAEAESYDDYLKGSDPKRAGRWESFGARVPSLSAEQRERLTGYARTVNVLAVSGRSINVGLEGQPAHGQRETLPTQRSLEATSERVVHGRFEICGPHRLVGRLGLLDLGAGHTLEGSKELFFPHPRRHIGEHSSAVVQVELVRRPGLPALPAVAEDQVEVPFAVGRSSMRSDPASSTSGRVTARPIELICAIERLGSGR